MITIVATLFSACAFSQTPVRLAGDFGEPSVIVAAPSDPRFAHLSWPKIVRTRDGVLVVAYIAGRFHGTHGEGCPAVSYSTDGGKTFSPPKILKEYGKNDTYTAAGNVALGLADDGSVILLSMAFNGDTANTIDGWRSVDDGKTWATVDVSRLAENRTGSVYGHVFAVPGKGLAVVGHYRRGSTAKQAGLWISYSTDNGKTWGDPETISSVGLVEPAFTYANGRMIGLARPANTPAWYSQFTSDDLGKSWNVVTKGLAAKDPKGVKFPSPGLFADPNDSDRVWALVSQRFSPPPDNPLFGRIDLYAASTKKLDWELVGTVTNFPRTLKDRNDLTYGWMAPLGGRKWYAVFYCGRVHGASDIYGLEFEIPAKPQMSNVQAPNPKE